MYDTILCSAGAECFFTHWFSPVGVDERKCEDQCLFVQYVKKDRRWCLPPIQPIPEGLREWVKENNTEPCQGEKMP